MLSSRTPKRTPGHRRQNSTPTLNRAAVVKPSPARTNQHSAHRRGLSIDLAMISQELGHKSQQETGTVSTNHQDQQQNTRATQRPAASRPGFQGFNPSEHFTLHDVESREGPRTFGVLNSAFVAEHEGFPTMNQAEQLLSAAIGSGTPANNAFQPRTPQHQRISDRMPAPLTVHGISSVSGPSYFPIDGRGDETIKAPRASAMKRGQSCQEAFAMARQNSNGILPSPPNTAPLKSSATFDAAFIQSPTFMDVTDLNMDFSACDTSYASSNYSPATNRPSPAMSEFLSSPELAPASLFGPNADAIPQFSTQFIQQSGGQNIGSSHDDAPGSPKKDGHSRSGSEDESAFNPMDYIVEDTGITDEIINAHIQGPDTNGKYTCLYEGCRYGPFGRKENIRAHVQTHLDDRRFRCDVCFRRFVRPNDLKRHWNIHLNKRDFKCVCNAAFNRHDALKRHRVRNEYCESGGTRGSPDSPKKDEKKRGRPRKIAPTETRERRERKALIRREIMKKKAESAASSVASSQPSPPASFDFSDQHQAQEKSPTHSPRQQSFTPPDTPGSVEVSLPFDIGSPKELPHNYGNTPELELGSSPPAQPFSFSLSSSATTEPSTQSTAFFDEIMFKTPNDDLDMYPLFGESQDQFSFSTGSKVSNDFDFFQAPSQDVVDEFQGNQV